jgi:hypothetical protein
LRPAEAANGAQGLLAGVAELLSGHGLGLRSRTAESLGRHRFGSLDGLFFIFLAVVYSSPCPRRPPRRRDFAPLGRCDGDGDAALLARPIVILGWQAGSGGRPRPVSTFLCHGLVDLDRSSSRNSSSSGIRSALPAMTMARVSGRRGSRLELLDGEVRGDELDVASTRTAME